MRHLDLTLPSPAQNLACDEALLDACDAGLYPPILRFWEPSTPFVVLGYAAHIASEVNRHACDQARLPILRRCSGGGTVLQSPGCLNYSLTLPFDHHPSLHSITSTNAFIMEKHRQTLAQLVPSPIRVQGFTDLALNNLKFSGNAQRRKRHALLFHGTFLLHFDIGLIETVLPPPPRQPSYRQNRSHRQFLTSLPLSLQSIKSALLDAWQASQPLDNLSLTSIDRLVAEKYSKDSWNFRS